MKIDFDEVKTASKMRLSALGCQLWDNSGLMLFPASWFSLIPTGFMVTTITGETKPFDPATCSDDRRFGALAFGVVATS